MFRHIIRFQAIALMVAALFAATSAPSGADHAAGAKPRRVSFLNDVVPVLTRSGCNQGACHGAAAGKGGFKLSLRGFAPEIDYDAITHQARSRRIDPASPEHSLFLRKPLLEVSHRGGKALGLHTPEYAILLRWLQEGAVGPDAHDPHVTALKVSPPAQSLSRNAQTKIRVDARFSDGTTRDVTHWCRFATNDENVATAGADGAVAVAGYGQTAIMIAYQDKVAVARVLAPYPNTIPPSAFDALDRATFIDRAVANRLKALHIAPGKRADDLAFIRRVTLDLTGALPAPNEARAFAADRDPRKRAKLVDYLMQRPEFIDFWTYKWSDMFRVNRGTLKDKGMWAYYSYLHDCVRDNKPWDQICREVLTSRGNTFLDGPSNYFRTALKPEELAENVSQGFLGIRVQCAKCHNHPLEKWTQNEYYGMANLFARVKYKADLSIYVNDEMTVYNTSSGDLIQPRLGRPVPPKPLGGPQMPSSSHMERRQYFADWLTRPDNWYFSHSIVNRVWAHFMGRGLVEPVDDMRETNPASNPELFDALADDFVKHRFDLRHLMRRIVTSETYQLSSSATPLNAKDDRYFSHFLVRRMTAEQLLDAVSQVTGSAEQFPGMPPGLRAVQLPDTKVKSEFMDILGRPPRVITCECERSQEPNMAQALMFINGEVVNRKVTTDGGFVHRLIQSGRSDGDLLDEIYWTALGRAPRPAERTAGLAAIRRACAPTAQSAPPTLGATGAANSAGTGAPAPADPRAVAAALTERRRHAFEDLLWVLINSKEFLFNH